VLSYLEKTMRSMGLSDGEFDSLDDNPFVIGVMNLVVAFNCKFSNNSA
jgi:hypothetical protein